MLEDLVASKSIDTSGQSCPVPLLKTKKALKELQPGEILEIISTDPGSEKDIPTFGNKGKNEYLGSRKTEATLLHYIQKG